MFQRRMNQDSRNSFFRAKKATIVGHGDCWLIKLSKSELDAPYNIFNDESWWVESCNAPVSYSSANAAIQAIERVRRDLPWKIRESKPTPEPNNNEPQSSVNKYLGERLIAGAIEHAANRIANEKKSPSQEQPAKKLVENPIRNKEVTADQLNEMARAAWAISELGYVPSTPEELAQVLKRIRELNDKKI